MAGYSGTPLPKKLGIKEKSRIAFVELPAGVKTELKDALSTCTLVKDGRGPIDFAMLFVKTQSELKSLFARHARQLTPAGMLWIAWPKKSSGVATDLAFNNVQTIGLSAGLVDTKICAVDEVWSGLKFVFRLKDRSRLMQRSQN